MVGGAYVSLSLAVLGMTVKVGCQGLAHGPSFVGMTANVRMLGMQWEG